MRGADQLFRIGTLAVLETRLESIRRLLEHARLGGDGAAAVLNVALPNCPCLLDHDRSASCVLRGTRNGRDSHFSRTANAWNGLARIRISPSAKQMRSASDATDPSLPSLRRAQAKCQARDRR